MAIQVSNGTTLALSATLPTTFDTDASTGYPSLTFTDIGEVVSIPALGSVSNPVTHNALGNIDVQKRPGTRDHGNITVPLVIDAADAGQILVLANDRTEVAFEITFPDGAIHYFTGYIMGMPTEPGGSDNFVSASLIVAITRAEVKVAAP